MHLSSIQCLFKWPLYLRSLLVSKCFQKNCPTVECEQSGLWERIKKHSVWTHPYGHSLDLTRHKFCLQLRHETRSQVSAEAKWHNSSGFHLPYPGIQGTLGTPTYRKSGVHPVGMRFWCLRLSSIANGVLALSCSTCQITKKQKTKLVSSSALSWSERSMSIGQGDHGKPGHSNVPQHVMR